MGIKYIKLSSQYINITNHASLNPDQITCCCWIRPLVSVAATAKYCIFKPYTAGSEPFYQYFLGLQNADLSFHCAIGGARKTAAASTAWTLGNLYFICGTADGTNVTVYKNLAQIAQVAGSGNLTDYNTDVSIGRAHTVFSDYSDVTVFDARIYNRAISTAEQAIIYNSQGNDNITNGLVMRLPSNENTAGSVVTAVRDVSPSGNNASPSGSPTYTEEPLKILR